MTSSVHAARPFNSIQLLRTEDFVVGLAPQVDGKELSFVKKGWLLNASSEAASGRYLLVVDEVNRADQTSLTHARPVESIVGRSLALRVDERVVDVFRGLAVARKPFSDIEVVGWLAV